MADKLTVTWTDCSAKTQQESTPTALSPPNRDGCIFCDAEAIESLPLLENGQYNYRCPSCDVSWIETIKPKG